MVKHNFATLSYEICTAFVVSFLTSFINGGKRLTRQHDTARGHWFSAPKWEIGCIRESFTLTYMCRCRWPGPAPLTAWLVSTAEPWRSPRSSPWVVAPAWPQHLVSHCTHSALYCIRHLCAWLTGGFYSQMLRQIANQTSPHWSDTTFFRKNLSDIGHAKKIYRQPRRALEPFLILQEEFILHGEIVTVSLNERSLLFLWRN